GSARRQHDPRLTHLYPRTCHPGRRLGRRIPSKAARTNPTHTRHISRHVPGELLDLLLPFSCLELYPSPVRLAADGDRHVAAATLEAQAIGGFGRDIQPIAVPEEGRDTLFHLLLRKPRLHF